MTLSRATYENTVQCRATTADSPAILPNQAPVDEAGSEALLATRLERLGEAITARRHLIGDEGWGNKSAIAVLPTGVGKSFVIALAPYAVLQHDVHSTK